MEIKRQEFDAAALRTGVAPASADALWTALVQGVPERPRFEGIHIAYYFGALICIGAMTFFMGIGWEMGQGKFILGVAIGYAALFWFLGRRMQQRGLPIPGGLLCTAAVCITPLAIYGFERVTGLWPQSDPGNYRDFHVWIKGGWIWMEIGTIVAALLAVRVARFPFFVAAIAFTLWYMSMDLAPLFFDKAYPTMAQRALV